MLQVFLVLMLLENWEVFWKNILETGILIFEKVFNIWVFWVNVVYEEILSLVLDKVFLQKYSLRHLLLLV